MLDIHCQDHKTWSDATVMMKNRLASRGGFSPVQRVLGYLLRLPGGLLSEGQHDLEHHEATRLSDRDITRAFFEADCHQSLKNVLAGGPRPQTDYVAGQMVYFYRIGHSKTGKKTHQRWYGPARVIVTDYASTIWSSYQGGVIKASPETIRPASDEEKLTISGWLEGLTSLKEEFEKQPKKGYVDLNEEDGGRDVDDEDGDREPFN